MASLFDRIAEPVKFQAHPERARLGVMSGGEGNFHGPSAEATEQDPANPPWTLPTVSA